MTLRLHPHPSNPKLWASYVDVLDQIIRPGDFVAYASISGRSPQLVIASVIQINRVDSRGAPIVARTYEGADPSCTIKLQPHLDARGFHRSLRQYNKKTKQWEDMDKPKAVTIQIPNNVLKINWNPPTESE